MIQVFRNERLRMARKRLGMIQHQLALEAGTGQAVISLIERGYFQPSQELADKIAKAVNMKVGEVFPHLKSPATK
jgi:DNA-binding XRE family transcriptional regulator